MAITISTANFFFAVLGGILIALSTSLHLATKGRITGMSGIFFSIISWDKPSLHWKISLVGGMFISSSLLYLIFSDQPLISGSSSSYIFAPAQINILGLNFSGYALSGFLVGVGTKLANGCTSGHGVCGMPRWSPRSWVAVGTFMTCGIIIATIRAYVGFWEGSFATDAIDVIYATNFTIISIIILIIGIIAILIEYMINQDKRDVFITFFVGFLFTLGLGFGGMLQRSKILGFLVFNSDWDPQLLILFMSAVGINMIIFHFILKKEKPLYSDEFAIPNNKVINFQLVAGSAIFGIGWGLGGLCPGPGMNLFTQFTLQINAIWITSLALGQAIAVLLDPYLQKSMPPLNKDPKYPYFSNQKDKDQELIYAQFK